MVTGSWSVQAMAPVLARESVRGSAQASVQASVQASGPAWAAATVPIVRQGGMIRVRWGVALEQAAIHVPGLVRRSVLVSEPDSVLALAPVKGKKKRYVSEMPPSFPVAPVVFIRLSIRKKSAHVLVLGPGTGLGSGQDSVRALGPMRRQGA